MSSDNWEIQVTVRINGRGRVGADGMVRFNLKFRLIL
jgi:hypothetical protein